MVCKVTFEAKEVVSVYTAHVSWPHLAETPREEARRVPLQDGTRVSHEKALRCCGDEM